MNLHVTIKKQTWKVENISTVAHNIPQLICPEEKNTIALAICILICPCPFGEQENMNVDINVTPNNYKETPSPPYMHSVE